MDICECKWINAFLIFFHLSVLWPASQNKMHKIWPASFKIWTICITVKQFKVTPTINIWLQVWLLTPYTTPTISPSLYTFSFQHLKKWHYQRRFPSFWWQYLLLWRCSCSLKWLLRFSMVQLGKSTSVCTFINLNICYLSWF